MKPFIFASFCAPPTNPSAPAHRPMHGSLRGALALVLLAIPLSSFAAGDLLLIDAPPATATRSAGVTFWSLPRYPGSSSQNNSLYPAFDFYGSSGLFASTENGLGWNLSSRKDLQAGVRLWPELGRKANEGHAGLSKLGVRIQQEAFVNYQVLPALLLQSGLLHGSGRHNDGAKLELGATTGLPIGPDLLGIGVSATFANGAHRQSYYGVSPEDSRRSGLPATHLGAGWQDVSLTLSAEHRFNPHWHADAQVIEARLLGSTASQAAFVSRMQTAATLSLWYDF